MPSSHDSGAGLIALLVGIGFIAFQLGSNIYPGPQWRSEDLARKKAAEAVRVKEELERKAEELRGEQFRIKQAQQEASRKAAAEADIIARKQIQHREEAERQLRLEAQRREWNDPEKVAERNQRHMEHLQSVGCIDIYGRVIENQFCLNTEAPL